MKEQFIFGVVFSFISVIALYTISTYKQKIIAAIIVFGAIYIYFHVNFRQIVIIYFSILITLLAIFYFYEKVEKKMFWRICQQNKMLAEFKVILKEKIPSQIAILSNPPRVQSSTPRA